MARLRYNGLKTGSSGAGVALSLGASLTNSATSVTFNAALTHSNGTAVPTITGSDYIPLEILDSSGNLSEIVYLTAYTAAATTGTISRGQEGTSGVAHSSGDKIIQSALARDVVSRFATLRCNSGTTTINTTTLAVVNNASGAGTVQVTVAADVGDLLEISLGAQAADNSTTTYIDFNVATFVSGSEVNRVGGTGTTGSIPSWSIRKLEFMPVNAKAFYTVVSGDLSSGTVNLRLMGVSNGTRSVFSTAAAPLDFTVRNLGPAAA